MSQHPNTYDERLAEKKRQRHMTCWQAILREIGERNDANAEMHDNATFHLILLRSQFKFPEIQK